MGIPTLVLCISNEVLDAPKTTKAKNPKIEVETEKMEVDEVV